MADSAQKAPVSVDQSETSNKLDVGGLVPLVTAAAEGIFSWIELLYFYPSQCRRSV